MSRSYQDPMWGHSPPHISDRHPASGILSGAASTNHGAAQCSRQHQVGASGITPAGVLTGTESNAKPRFNTVAVTITCHGDPIAVFPNKNTRVELHDGDTATVEGDRIVIEQALIHYRVGK